MGYITSFGYFQGAIWFYNLRAPQICFRNFWDQKIDQDETRDGCEGGGRGQNSQKKEKYKPL